MRAFLLLHSLYFSFPANFVSGNLALTGLYLNMNIWFSLLWSTESWVRGPESATCAGLAWQAGTWAAISDYRALKKFLPQVALSWFSLEFFKNPKNKTGQPGDIPTLSPLHCPTLPSCAEALPQYWFSSQKSSRIAFGSDFQMTSSGSNLDSNLNCAIWRAVKVLYALKSLNKLCGVWILFGLLKMPKLRQAK